MAALNIVRKFFPKVEKVLDSTRPARIEVTDKDVASKALKDHNHCAMAVACKRKFHLDGVIISRTTAYLIKGKRARRFHLPSSISREVVSFDRGAGFAPGEYELKAVPKYRRFGNRPIDKQGPKTSRLKHPRFRHLTVKIRAVLHGEQPEE